MTPTSSNRLSWLAPYHHRVILWAVLGVLAALPAVSTAPRAFAEEAKPSTDLLDDAWWEETSYGLKLRPPAGATQVRHAVDDALVHFGHRAGYRLSVYIKQSELAINLKQLKSMAFEQFSYAYPSSTLLAERVKAPPRMRGSAVMLAAADNEGKPFRWGQVFVAIDDYAFAMIQLDAEPDAYDQAFETLEQMLTTLHLMNPAALRERRAQRIRAGEDWRKQLIQMPARPLPGEQWFRIVENGQDVGYERIRIITDADQLQTEQLNPGIAIKVQTRIAVNQRVYDIARNVYESNDRALEIWETTTTLRKTENGVERTATWADTGFRTGQLIQVTRDEPAEAGAIQDRDANPVNDRHLQWPKPPVGYLSQADLYRLIPYWPSLAEGVSFYAYDRGSSSLTQRQVSIARTQDGQTVVSIRPRPNAALQRLVYDKRGELLRREMASGRAYVATTADQIAKIWRIRR